MPDYTIYKGNRHTGTTEACTGVGGGFVWDPPQNELFTGTGRIFRGCYIKQDATTYRWIYDERCSTVPTTWNASMGHGA